MPSRRRVRLRLTSLGLNSKLKHFRTQQVLPGFKYHFPIICVRFLEAGCDLFKCFDNFVRFWPDLSFAFFWWWEAVHSSSSKWFSDTVAELSRCKLDRCCDAKTSSSASFFLIPSSPSTSFSYTISPYISYITQPESFATALHLPLSAIRYLGPIYRIIIL